MDQGYPREAPRTERWPQRWHLSCQPCRQTPWVTVPACWDPGESPTPVFPPRLSVMSVSTASAWRGLWTPSGVAGASGPCICPWHTVLGHPPGLEAACFLLTESTDSGVKEPCGKLARALDSHVLRAALPASPEALGKEAKSLAHPRLGGAGSGRRQVLRRSLLPKSPEQPAGHQSALCPTQLQP